MKNAISTKDGYQIQIEAVATFFTIFEVCMNIWFITKVKIFVFIEWSHRYFQISSVRSMWSAEIGVVGSIHAKEL